MFVEEPVPQENVDALTQVTDHVPMPIATGERLLSRWEFRQVFEKQAAAYLRRLHGECYGDAAAIRADLFRYAELFERGGWYVHAEHEALLPLEDVLLWPVDHVLLVRPGKDRIVNNFIGAVPGSALMKAALIKGCQNLLEQAGGSVVDMTGPVMLTGLVKEYERSPEASYVIVPSNVVFGGAMQVVHNQAEYKIHGHWRYTELSSD